MMGKIYLTEIAELRFFYRLLSVSFRIVLPGGAPVRGVLI
jgi:hypothetical protein